MEKIYLVKGKYALKDGTVKEYIMRQKKQLKKLPGGMGEDVKNAIVADYDVGLTKLAIMQKYKVTYHKLCEILPVKKRVDVPRLGDVAEGRDDVAE